MTDIDRLRKERKKCAKLIEDIKLERLAIDNQKEIESKKRSSLIDELEKKRRAAIKEKNTAMDALNEQLKQIDYALMDAQHRLKELDLAVKDEEIANRDLILSDHAILRFLERKKNMDMEQVKMEMLTDEMKTAARLCRGNFEFRGFIVKDNVVVTVLPE